MLTLFPIHQLASCSNLQHSTTSQLPLNHQLAILVQIRQVAFRQDGLKRFQSANVPTTGCFPDPCTHMNEAPRRKVQRLLDVLERPHHAAHNLQPLQRQHQRRRPGHHRRVLRQPDRDHRAPGPQEPRRALVPLPRRRRHQNTVRPVCRQRHDLRCDVLARRVVDVRFRAQPLAEVLLLVAAVDRDDAHAHRFGVLHGEVAETAACAREDYPLTGLNGASLACRVGCDAAAHDGARLFVRDALGDPGRVFAVCNAVFLYQQYKH